MPSSLNRFTFMCTFYNLHLCVCTEGLGQDLVRTLHKQDAIIYALARNPDNLAKLKEEFPGIHTIQADLTDWEATRKQLETLEPMDHLINNAGIVTISPFLSIKPDDFDE